MGIPSGAETLRDEARLTTVQTGGSGGEQEAGDVGRRTGLVTPAGCTSGPKAFLLKDLPPPLSPAPLHLPPPPPPQLPLHSHTSLLHLTPFSSSSCFLLPEESLPAVGSPRCPRHSHSGPRCHTLTTVTQASPQAQLEFLTLLPSQRVTQTSPFISLAPECNVVKLQILIEHLLHTQTGAGCHRERWK